MYYPLKIKNDRISYSETYLPQVNKKDYNSKIDSKNIFYQPINNDIKKYENRKIATGQGDDYTTGCFLD